MPLSHHGSRRLILCYELFDQETLTLYQVKPLDVRAFAASNAFQSGAVIVSQSLKSRNTSTQFYLKDVTWTDSKLFLWVQWWLPSIPTNSTYISKPPVILSNLLKTNNSHLFLLKSASTMTELILHYMTILHLHVKSWAFITLRLP